MPTPHRLLSRHEPSLSVSAPARQQDAVPDLDQGKRSLGEFVLAPDDELLVNVVEGKQAKFIKELRDRAGLRQ